MIMVTTTIKTNVMMMAITILAFRVKSEIKIVLYNHSNAFLVIDTFCVIGHGYGAVRKKDKERKRTWKNKTLLQEQNTTPVQRDSNSQS